MLHVFNTMNALYGELYTDGIDLCDLQLVLVGQLICTTPMPTSITQQSCDQPSYFSTLELIDTGTGCCSDFNLCPVGITSCLNNDNGCVLNNCIASGVSAKGLKMYMLSSNSFSIVVYVLHALHVEKECDPSSFPLYMCPN